MTPTEKQSVLIERLCDILERLEPRVADIEVRLRKQEQWRHYTLGVVAALATVGVILRVVLAG